MDATTTLIKRLTEASGVSGYEAPVREIVKEYMDPLGKLSKDKLGSLICEKTGGSKNPRVMLAGHMDEIGFVVQHITDDGFIKFLPLGGWFDQVMLAHKVIILTKNGPITGVFGVKPPHVISPEERNKVITKNEMYIDIGATSKEEMLEAGVQVGDPIIPKVEFEILFNDKTYLSKAFDDRIGVALMISSLEKLNEEKHPNTIFAAATVMEEMTLGGAKTSASLINPDVAIVLESGLAGDVPGMKPEESTFKFKKGPGILMYDARMIPNIMLRDFVLDTAKDIDIPVQPVLMPGGATDGGMIHLNNDGVPTICLAVPARHIHSHHGILHRDDYDMTVTLLVELIKRLDEKTVQSFSE